MGRQAVVLWGEEVEKRGTMRCFIYLSSPPPPESTLTLPVRNCGSQPTCKSNQRPQHDIASYTEPTPND